MLLPTGTAMHGEGISKICDIIRFIVQNAHNIDRALVKNSSSEIEQEVAVAPTFPNK